MILYIKSDIVGYFFFFFNIYSWFVDLTGLLRKHLHACKQTGDRCLILISYVRDLVIRNNANTMGAKGH